MVSRKTFLTLLSSVLIIVTLFILPAYSQDYNVERILSFHSDIKVHEDGSMTVTETIKVNAAGKEIRHGIYRDFPTKYKDRLGNNYVVDFDVKKVLVDGMAEDYHFQGVSNGTRVYIGKKEIFVPQGEHTYTLTYNTDRQLGFFKDFDELYWNVTGNGWSFPIDAASAAIELPEGAYGKVLGLDGYAGVAGSVEKAFTTSTDTAGKITFISTRRFEPREGLTIVVSWQKGCVSVPDAQKKLKWFLRDNRTVMVGLVGIIILFIYYMIVWSKFGKDPARGTIIPLYTPPNKLSPAPARYIMKMGYDSKVFTAAIINMAVKGYIKIVDQDGTFTIKKTGFEKADLSPEEALVARVLLGDDKEIELKNENHEEVNAAIRTLKRTLAGYFEKVYFLTNVSYFSIGVFISALILFGEVMTINSTESAAVALFISIWLTGWSFGVVMLLWQAISMWKGFISGGGRRFSMLAGAIGMSLFAVPFVVGEIVGIVILAFFTSMLVVAILPVVIATNFLFYHLLKAPTLAGRRVMDLMEGFRMYLSVAEKDRLNLLNPPEKTPELFEKYLPYALALDVEQAWAEQFSGILERAAKSGEGYSPSWYAGPAWTSLNAANFASGLGGSLSGAISTSSVAPGSSSGGGGGSSGGGGGGGGGGGW